MDSERLVLESAYRKREEPKNIKRISNVNPLVLIQILIQVRVN